MRAGQSERLAREENHRLSRRCQAREARPDNRVSCSAMSADDVVTGDIRSGLTEIVSDALSDLTTADPGRQAQRALAEQVRVSAMGASFNARGFNALQQHPSRAAVVRFLTEDHPTIRTLFSPRDRPYVSIAAFGGGILDASLLPTALVQNALIKARLEGRGSDVAVVVAHAMAAIEELSRAVNGEAATVNYLFLVDGLALTSGERIATPWGTVYPVDTLRDANGDLPLLLGDSDASAAILVLPVVVTVDVSHGAPPPPSPSLFEEFARLRRPSQLLSLGILLATVSSELMPCAIVRETALVPWRIGGGSVGSLPPVIRRVRSRPLTPAECRSVEEWCLLLEGLNQTCGPVLESVGCRLTDAAYTRHAPRDRLVDAVTAWESLFGGRQATTLRVTAAIAKILGPDIETRLALRKSLASLYEARSALVHGNQMHSHKLMDGVRVNIAEMADIALRMGLLGLGALIRDAPSLLPLESEARSLRVLLG